jgi:methyl-accepting chemotaxis protein-1 (serine sensor receptor)
LLQQLSEKIVALSADSLANADETRQHAMLLSLGAMLCACTLGVIGAVVISRKITGELGGEPDEAKAAMRRIATGDLAHGVALRAGDATSLMAAMEAMRASLIQIVTQVRNSSDAIAIGSAQIASGNADLSDRTQLQASGLEETAASMEELGSAVSQNAEGSKRAKELALGASAVATKGGEVVGQVVDTMKAINDSSKRVADIIGVIDGIAFQTNILALNAAVEAARAGEQGRGFAVVASEVRALAQRSAAAAKEIKTLITTSSQQVKSGVGLVGQAGEALHRIVKQVASLDSLIAGLAETATAQARGLADVNHAVTQMDQATRQSAEVVAGSSRSGSEMMAEAAVLTQALAGFGLTGSGPVRGSNSARAASPLPKSRAPAAPADKRASAGRAQAPAAADDWSQF